MCSAARLARPCMVRCMLRALLIRPKLVAALFLTDCHEQKLDVKNKDQALGLDHLVV